MKKAENALNLLRDLEKLYPEAHCELIYRNPWQLLVATILSAQCTDKRVNQVTAKLFQILPDPQQMAAATQEQVEGLIRSTGFFRNKAKNLILCAQQVLSRHQGQVPAELEALVALNGVGRKTANVILGNAYQIPGMVVDTHVKRLAFRFGWTNSDNPVQIEKDLCKLIPPQDWIQMGHILIAHGRALCKAPTPHCSICPLVDLCPRKGVQRAK
ncbi:MAG: endonuclease III [Deltaproteobacteria bacterium]|nr:endonuclease III [Deltaproteobacteria bacterium]MCW8892885.1 endonuclease III [Deltaproteobacteria bacterium]MCW9048966.1 endonuclease III [Deltaproteobacteria bacterium]